MKARARKKKKTGNPQHEDGFTRLANELFEALAMTDLAPAEWRIVMVVIRKTYGFHKTVDWISNSQLVLATGLTSNRCTKAVSGLVRKGVLSRWFDGKHLRLAIAKRYRSWVTFEDEIEDEMDAEGGAANGTQGVPKTEGKGFRKRKVTKETITKEKHTTTPKPPNDVEGELRKTPTTPLPERPSASPPNDMPQPLPDVPPSVLEAWCEWQPLGVNRETLRTGNRWWSRGLPSARCM
jgi:phage replication O-like protein O